MKCVPLHKGLKLYAPAKINLTLEILYRRADGYHQLQTVMQELAYSDLLYLEECPAGRLELICDDPFLPSSEENLALRAASLIQQHYAPHRGAHLALYKKIPVAAGLGGGSSDAATVLKGLNDLWQLNLAPASLQELAARLGSDVPFFLCGGTALAQGRGEIIHPLPPFPRAFVLLVSPPGTELSTPLVYRSLKWDKIKSGEKTANFVQLLRDGTGKSSGDPDLLARLLELMVNDLEAGAFALVRELSPLKKMLQEMGLKPLLSGSGPTFFAISNDHEKLRAAGDELTSRGYRVILTSTK
ncbi:MAG: 4-(cytidine 5'-diphospho)-2-C-methyl-D-erythritol kinase [Bacillota bacterium]